MRFRTLVFPWVILLLGQPLLAREPHSILHVFRENCVRCHGKDGKVKGKVNLLEVEDSVALSRDPELLQKLIEAIDFDEMPPEDEPPLEPEVRETLLADLKSLLRQSDAGTPSFTRAPVRRMNRFQYHNAVTDLFDLRCVVFTLPERMMRDHNHYFQPETGKMAEVVTVGSRPLGKSQLIENRLDGVAAFPQDLRAENGFDNRGDHLSLSPLLMEAFLTLGQSITQSPDFTPKNVGIWKAFFEAPEKTSDPGTEVRLRLEPFLKKAFRRPVDPGLLDRYASYALKQIDGGSGFSEAMKAVAAAVISSPKFLYLYDGTESGEEPDRVDGFNLASRLSFFLWGSLPDETLLDLAASGELRDPAALEAQFKRMIRDQKLKRFCDSFPSQWLQLEHIISSAPNPEKFPDFYFGQYRDSMHMMLEPLLLFETVLIENQPVSQLIDSDFTYRSDLLEEAYGDLATAGREQGKKAGNDVSVLKFHRVPVTDRRNGGVITNAAVMTMTSGTDRTKPITRGAWIATVIFNNPPEPPPGNVPPLAEKPSAEEENLTLRERLSLHRERSDCRGCHEKIDPLGFALENFDPIGRWRDTYENGREVDVSGSLFRQRPFSDVIEFKDALLAEKDRFTRGFAAHLLSFALARELGPGDQPVLDRIAETTAADGYRIQTLLKEVILSEPFLGEARSAKVETAKSNR